ncbi:MAG: type II secretory pathway component PulJ [Planctomycetota bacterium]|jgi:type II secretory pathway component PulJ
MHDEKETRESGFTIVEVVMALSLMAVGMLSLLGTMSSAGQADEAVRKRSLAFDAAHGIIQGVIADSQERGIEDFVNWWGDPANQTFTVEGLENPLVDDVDALAIVTIDATDPERVAVQVLVSWSDAGRTEQLIIPYTLTGLEQ